MSTTKIGTWREVKAIEVERPCGCVEYLIGKDAIKSRAGKLAAKACYQCQLKARGAARRGDEPAGGLDISIGDYS